MATEIKETLEKVVEQKNIKLLKGVDSGELVLKNTSISISEFDYYKIVQEDMANMVIICWNNEDMLDDVCVFIATYED